MTAEINYSATAGDLELGMTLEELAYFVSTAYAQGATGEESIRVRTGWKAQVRSVTVSFAVETVSETVEDVLETLARYGEGKASKPTHTVGAAWSDSEPLEDTWSRRDGR